MPISFSTARTAINNFNDDAQVIFDPKAGTFKSVSFWQKIKLFFGIPSARAQNQKTLNELEAAILNDPRLDGDDIQDYTQELFKDIRTDRAINVSDLKGIVDGFERIAANTHTQPMLKQRVMMHMAFCYFPEELGRCQDEITEFVADHLSRDRALQQNPGGSNIRQMTRDTLFLIRDLGRVLHGSQGAPDRRLLPIYVKHLVPLLWRVDPYGNRQLRRGTERWSRMEALSQFLVAAEARAQRANQPALVDLALRCLDGILDMPEPGPFGFDTRSGEPKAHLQSFIETVPLEDLVRIDAGLTPVDVFNRYLAGLQQPAPAPDPAAAPAPADAQ
ncbi:MAG: hypothetical protein IK066_04185 [Kiritimatiellae bacterium]|nr:hypothetical protein [Kiritimatiellia bacterium]